MNYHEIFYWVILATSFLTIIPWVWMPKTVMRKYASDLLAGENASLRQLQKWIINENEHLKKTNLELKQTIKIKEASIDAWKFRFENNEAMKDAHNGH